MPDKLQLNDVVTPYAKSCETICNARSMQFDKAPLQLCTTRYGKVVYPYYDHYIASCLELYGEWSQLEVDFLCGLLAEGDTVIDIGAFIGTHTLAFAQRVRATGRVYAFEPSPYIYNCLVSNITINNHFNTQALNSAIGDSVKKEKFMFPPLNIFNNFGGSRLTNAGGSAPEAWKSLVNIAPLDDFNFEKCTLIKIDAEGMGIPVLHGAKKTINKCRPFISVEVEGETEQEETNAIIELMARYDYSVYNFYTPLYNPNNFFNNKGNVFPHVISLNLFLAPNEKKIDNLQKLSLKN